MVEGWWRRRQASAPILAPGATLPPLTTQRPTLPVAPTLLGAFVLFGALWGAWQALLPELAGALELGEGALGLMLTIGFAFAFPAMLATGSFMDRFGAGPAMAVSAVGMAAALILVATAPGLPAVVAGVAVLVAASGAFDVAINASAMVNPAWSRPARLTLLHAGFSGGGAAGALAGGVALGVGVPFSAGYVVVAATMVAFAAAALATRWPRSMRPGAPGAPPARLLAAALVPLAVIAALAFLAEGSMESWAALYLRTVLGASAFVGALGPAAFHLAMMSGRLVGAAVAGALGARATLLVAGSATAAGMLVALGVTLPAIAIPGLALAALGASFVVPVVFSLAAARSGTDAGRAASYIMTLGYAGFLIGPSLIGLVAEAAGLRLALLVVPLAGAAVAIGSRSARSPG